MRRGEVIYDEEEAEPLYGSNLRPQQQKQMWDVFQDPPIKSEVGSTAESKWIDGSVKAIKIFIYILTFSIVLGCAVISKLTLLLATSQLKINNTRPYCNKELDTNQRYEVKIPRVERVEWMWVIMFIYFVPEIGTFIRSVRICCFKKWKFPTISDFVTLFATESLSAIGSALLVFNILPVLDVIKGVMLTNAFCLVPAFLAFFSRNPRKPDNRLKMMLDGGSIVIQVSALVIWPLVEDDPTLFTLPVAIILISFGWWENYVSEKSTIGFIRNLAKQKKDFDNSRYFSYIFVSLWKCFAFFCTALIIISLKENGVDFMFKDISEAFGDRNINVTEVRPILGEETLRPELNGVLQPQRQVEITVDSLVPIWVFIINFLATYLCYAFGKFACKILIQGFSYAFPINLVVPVTISVLIAACGAFITNECAFYNLLPAYLFFNVPFSYYLDDFITNQHAWIWLLWMLSQMWITVHIWNPSSERLARTEKLFVKPLYDAFLIDQSLAMNRRRHGYDDEDEENIFSNQPSMQFSNKDSTTRIYACGTMWHETREEMMAFLKSIVRLDEDQCARRMVRNYMQFNIPDYYELETHIFFDDAFIRKHQEDKDPHVNQFVLMLVSALDEAASEVHQIRIRVRPPKLYTTPYGGRLVWTLPGKTKMIAHLKDKKKIRAKKRWSQVMYMYYLLGHKLMEDDTLIPERKDVIAENTYILALDGDIDFQPKAVHLLVDLMKKNKVLGAACGRIHPIGSGPMVWYQMFEYAIGHWLQKATEHMIGCVLCSPGCFSLFRGKALMDDNVMKKYTTKSEEARHYVQYDQGEDRWLCTLLLQRGYRVEYSAASDAYTHCPEALNEFYKQRRRWMPSTIANILDLLSDYKRTVRINDSISRLYIVYQMILMIGTVLGPGTIFLMLVGAFVAAFQLDQWSSFVWNVVPILIFMFVCFMFESEDVHLIFANLLSTIYGLVMMAVLVGVMLQIESDGFLAPSSLFFFCVAGEMIITALLHPQEFECLKYGVVYYVTVPSMYMLLVIYSVFNMNNVSWGTREVTVVEEENESEEGEDKEEPEETNKLKNKAFMLFGEKNEDNRGTIEISLAGLFKLLLCTHRKTEEENIDMIKIQQSLSDITKKIDKLERQYYPEFEDTTTPLRRNTTVLEGSCAARSPKQTNQSNIDSSSDYSQVTTIEEIEENSWLYDGDLARGEVDCLPPKETTFWKNLLQLYLFPIDDTKKKKRIAKELKDLRDKAVFAFFMLNALFVLVIFLLTLKKEFLNVKWPLGIKTNFTYMDDTYEIQLEREYLELEPIGFVFLLFFAVLLVVQFIAMLFHRFGTLAQLLSTTIINFSFFKTSAENLTQEEILERDAIKIAKKLQKLRGLEENDEVKEEEVVARRKTAANLARSQSTFKENINDLDLAFRRRLAKFKRSDYVGPVRRETIAALNMRRETIKRRQSEMQPANRNDEDNFYPGYVNSGYDAGCSEL